METTYAFLLIFFCFLAEEGLAVRSFAKKFFYLWCLELILFCFVVLSRLRLNLHGVLLHSFFAGSVDPTSFLVTKFLF